MVTIIKKGARVVVFQKFLGGHKQLFMTLASWNDAHYITSSALPFPFIIQANGKLIPDKVKSPPLPSSHPS